MLLNGYSHIHKSRVPIQHHDIPQHLIPKNDLIKSHNTQIHHIVDIKNKCKINIAIYSTSIILMEFASYIIIHEIIARNQIELIILWLISYILDASIKLFLKFYYFGFLYKEFILKNILIFSAINTFLLSFYLHVFQVIQIYSLFGTDDMQEILAYCTKEEQEEQTTAEILLKRLINNLVLKLVLLILINNILLDTGISVLLWYFNSTKKIFYIHQISKKQHKSNLLVTHV